MNQKVDSAISWIIFLLLLGLLVAFIALHEQSQSSKDFNAAQCAVYGYQANCKTPLEGN